MRWVRRGARARAEPFSRRLTVDSIRRFRSRRRRRRGRRRADWNRTCGISSRARRSTSRTSGRGRRTRRISESSIVFDDVDAHSVRDGDAMSDDSLDESQRTERW